MIVRHDAVAYFWRKSALCARARERAAPATGGFGIADELSAA